MAALLKFVKNTSWLAVSKLGVTVVWVLLTPIFTLELSSSQYGVVDLLKTTVAFAIPLVSCQVADAIQVYLLKNKFTKGSILTHSILIFLTGWLFSFIFYVPINKLLEGFAVPFYLLVFFQGLSSLFYSYFKGIDNVRIAAIINLIEVFSFLLLSLFTLIGLDLNLEGLILSLIVSKGITTVIYIFSIPLWNKINLFSFSLNQTRAILLFSVPLIPNMIGWWLNNMSDRYLIKTFVGVESNGIYGVAAIFPTLINIICTVLISSWIITAMQNDKKKDGRMFNIMSSLFSISITTIAMLMILALPLIFPIFVQSKDFLPAQNFVPILLISAVFSGVASLFGVTYLSQNDTFQAAITTVASGALNIVLNFILIPFMGIMGAVVSTYLSFSLLAFLRYLYIRKTTSLIVSPIALFVLIAYPPLFFMEMYGFISNRLLILFSILFVLGMCLKASLIIKQNKIIRQLIS